MQLYVKTQRGNMVRTMIIIVWKYIIFKKRFLQDEWTKLFWNNFNEIISRFAKTSWTINLKR